MKQTFYLAILFGALNMVSCSTEDFEPEVDTTNRVEGTGFFTFKTAEGVSLSLDYGKENGAGALVEIFTSSPTSSESVYKVVLDQNGQYNGSLDFASWVSELWLSTPALGPEPTVRVKVQDGTVKYSCKATKTSTETKINYPLVQTKYEVLAYEDDLEETDFDLNDVVFTHRRDIFFGDESNPNAVKSVVDYFNNYNCGAQNVNAFAFQYANNYVANGDITLEVSYTDDAVDLGKIDGSSVKWSTYTMPDSYLASSVRANDIAGIYRLTYILNSDCRHNLGRTYRIKRTFANNVDKKEFEKVESMELLNPFIICKYSSSSKSYKEIHIAGGKNLLSERAVNANGWMDYFAVISEDGKRQYPYAFRLLDEKSFDLVSPGVLIDVEYPDFQKWIQASLNNSSDKSYNQWYKNKK